MRYRQTGDRWGCNKFTSAQTCQHTSTKAYRICRADSCDAGRTGTAGHAESPATIPPRHCHTCASRVCGPICLLTWHRPDRQVTPRPPIHTPAAADSHHCRRFTPRDTGEGGHGRRGGVLSVCTLPWGGGPMPTLTLQRDHGLVAHGGDRAGGVAVLHGAQHLLFGLLVAHQVVLDVGD